MDAANKILYKEESFAVIGACMKVHRSLGAGFLKEVFTFLLDQKSNKKITA